MGDQACLEIPGSLAARRQQHHEMRPLLVVRGLFAVMIESYFGIVCDTDHMLVLPPLGANREYRLTIEPGGPRTRFGCLWDSSSC